MRDNGQGRPFFRFTAGALFPARLDLAPQSPGLLAVSLGLSSVHADDHAMLERGMIVYDALYAWCRDCRDQGHDWNPAAMQARA